MIFIVDQYGTEHYIQADFISHVKIKADEDGGPKGNHRIVVYFKNRTVDEFDVDDDGYGVFRQQLVTGAGYGS